MLTVFLCRKGQGAGRDATRSPPDATGTRDSSLNDTITRHQRLSNSIQSARSSMSGGVTRDAGPSLPPRDTERSGLLEWGGAPAARKPTASRLAANSRADRPAKLQIETNSALELEGAGLTPTLDPWSNRQVNEPFPLYIDTPPCKMHTVYIWRILQGRCYIYIILKTLVVGWWGSDWWGGAEIRRERKQLAGCWTCSGLSCSGCVGTGDPAGEPGVSHIYRNPSL